MKPFQRLPLVAGACLLMLLSACASTYTVQELVADEETRRQIIAECLLMGTEASEEDNCRIAAKAQVKATGQKVLDLLDE